MKTLKHCRTHCASRASRTLRAFIPSLTLLLAISLLQAIAPTTAFAAAAPSGDQINEANNPLTPKATVNIHNYAQELYGTDDWADSILLRGVLPAKIGGAVNIFRATVPLVFTPGGDFGLGDINVVDFLPFRGPAGIEFGIGPQITLPTATCDETGTGKWQAGVGGMIAAPQKWGMLGALVTWQTSFAGERDRATQNNLTFQPLVFLNLPHSWYLRSTAVCNFQLNNAHAYSVPVGFGAGKVFALPSGITFNAFIEPQWTIIRHGAATPQFQVFVGFNTQFPLRPKKS